MMLLLFGDCYVILYTLVCFFFFNTFYLLHSLFTYKKNLKDDADHTLTSERRNNRFTQLRIDNVVNFHINKVLMKVFPIKRGIDTDDNSLIDITLYSLGY